MNFIRKLLLRKTYTERKRISTKDTGRVVELEYDSRKDEFSLHWYVDTYPNGQVIKLRFHNNDVDIFLDNFADFVGSIRRRNKNWLRKHRKDKCRGTL